MKTTSCGRRRGCELVCKYHSFSTPTHKSDSRDHHRFRMTAVNSISFMTRVWGSTQSHNCGATFTPELPPTGRSALVSSAASSPTGRILKALHTEEDGPLSCTCLVPSPECQRTWPLPPKRSNEEQGAGEGSFQRGVLVSGTDLPPSSGGGGLCPGPNGASRRVLATALTCPSGVAGVVTLVTKLTQSFS